MGLEQKQEVPEAAKTGNTQGEAASRKLQDRAPAISVGVISRVIPGSYIMTAQEQGGSAEVQCIYVPGMLSLLWGVKDCSLPAEGTPVLMIALPQDPRMRIALCSLPDQIKGYKDIGSVDWAAQFGSSPEPGVNYWSENCYRGEGGDPKKQSHVPTSSDRPWSLLQGEWAHGNPMGVFLALFHYMATIKATERAKLECFVLDDLVRLTSGQFQHWNAFGETHIFNDAGYTNIEMGGSHYFPETRGFDSYGRMVDSTETQTENEERFKQVDPRLTMKRRFRMFMGSMGDMCQLYLRNMQDGVSPTTYDSEEAWGACFKLHLDNSGALNIVSSAGLGLSLCDRIPVPKRRHEAWDPAGDKPELADGDMFQKKVHFGFDDEAGGWPWLRNIQAMDAEPWEDALSYQRYDELKKDFNTPEVSDLAVAPDKYDNLESQTNHSRYPGRRAGVKIEEDGSIRIWDNFGGEIYMRGGDMVLSCPGSIIMQPGKGIIGLADNVIMKARTGVDITSEANNVRIAGNNVLMHAKSGMLLEADGESPPEYSGTGDDVTGGGIVIKASRSMVVLWGQTVMSIGGRIVARAAANIIHVADSIMQGARNILMETNGSAGVMLDGDSATVLGGSVTLAGGSSVGIFKGTQVMVPLEWADSNFSIYGQMSPLAAGRDTMYRVNDSWLAPMDSATRDSVRFTFRTSAQYGADTGIETWQPSPTMSVYQTRWQLLAVSGYQFIGVSPETWTETAVNSTYPWPGAESRSTAYVTVPGLDNVDPSTLDPLDRAKLSGTFRATVQKSTMDKYIVAI
jgi:hypothetical protein